MKNLLTLLAAVIISASVSGQTPTDKKLVLNNGKIEVQQAKAKKTDSVVKIIDGIKVYQGAKGGLYYYRVSKSGKTYKSYIK